MMAEKKDLLQEQLFPSSYTVLGVTYSRTGDSVTLALSGEETLVLPSEQYALSQLREGSVIEKEDLKEFKKMEVLYAARRKGMKLLDRRAFTAAQLKARLGEELFSREIVEEVIRDFTERGFLNDKKYAEGWIAAQLRRKPQGRKLLYLGMLRKGIARQQAEQMLAAGYPAELEEETCAALMAKMAERAGREAARLLPALVRRGFSPALVKRVFQALKKHRS
jgi:regulatory protein